MVIKKRVIAGMLALAMCTNVITLNTFAQGDSRSTPTQTSSEQETVYVNSYTASSRKVDFSNHWRFNLGSGSEATDYNDSTWKNVDLPHDYSIEQDYSANNEAESGYLPGGTGWYRKAFTISSDWKNKVVSINFGGVYMNATVYLNGHKLGFHPYGYTAFSLELPQEYLDYSGENVIAVKVEHKLPSSRWYSGSGIYRSVSLTITDPVHVALDGTYVTTPKLADSKGADGTTNVTTTVQNQSSQAANITVRQTIYKQGDETAKATATSTPVTIEPGASADVNVTLTVNNPDLWNTETPNLYNVKTEVLSGETVLDTYTTEFGYRWTDFNNTTGFSLNGVPTKLKGVCMHHDQGALGSEAWYRAIERQMEILKQMGCNAVRVTHNPAASELIQIANHMGIMLVDEAFDMWVMEKNGNVNDYSSWFEVTIGEDNAIIGGQPDMTWAEFDVKSMAYEARNAPSVIMYSLGNEIFEGTANDRANEYPEIARNLCTWLYEVDNTRPPTFGQNTNNDGVAAKVAQVLNEFKGLTGLNYASTGRYDNWVNKGLLVYFSETASAVNSRGVYDRKASNGDGGKGDYLLTSYDKSAVGWGAVASEAWWRTLQRDNSMGEFVWTGFDYIGEPTPWNGTGSGAQGAWPNSPKSSYFGIIDTNGLPKDTYYLYQSLWNDDVNTLHILPTWNEDEIVLDKGKTVEVVVYSDAPVVKLYLNGEEVGSATSTEHKSGAKGNGSYTYRTFDTGTGCFAQASGTNTRFYATFNVPYTKGTLEAKAFKADGTTQITNTDGRSVVKTTSDASKLTVSADRKEITADGDDLSYITIDVRDASGNLVNTDDVNVQLSIEGEGKIIGADNGRQPDHTSYQSLNQHTGAGQLVAVVQSTENAGSFTVTAKANGLTSGSVTVNTTPAPSNDTGDENPIVSYQISRYHYVKIGSTPALPETATVTYKDGSTKDMPITWNSYDPALIGKVGSFSVSGKLGDTGLTTSVNITMLDQVTALLNYSAAVQVGGKINLPASRPAVLSDGTILNAEFPVSWNIPENLTAQPGTYTVNGSSQVFGENIAVTAFVRVAEGKVNIGSNVAQSAHLSQSIPAEQQSGKLEGIIDGKLTSDSAWTNSKWSTSAPETNKQSTITFTYDTAQNLGQMELYFLADGSSTALPENVTLQWNLGSDENGWTDLKPEVSDAVKVEEGTDTPVYKVVYTFAPVPAVQLRVTMTNSSGHSVGLAEAKLNLAMESFPISQTDALTGISVNGQAWSASQLSARTFATEALVVDRLDITNGNNAAYTVLPAHDNVVKILTESEDHSTRGTYTIQLATSGGSLDAADDSRDYDYTKTTATAPSEQSASGNEGPVKFAVDNNSSTFWHSKWDESLASKPENRYIQLKLTEPTLLDALRYLPRPSLGNGIVTEYRVEVSTDGSSWTPVSTGSWAYDTQWKIAVFDQPVQAQYVRLYGVSTKCDSPNQFMSAAEVRVRKAEEKTDLSTAQITLESDSFPYNGQAIEPKPTVTLNDTTLVYGLDYLIDYQNNVAPGTATMTIRGIVGYSGSVSKNFTIQAENLESIAVQSISTATLTGIAPTLPETVQVYFNDGTELSCPVTWDLANANFDVEDNTTVTVNGTATLEGSTASRISADASAGIPVTAKVRVTSGTVSDINLALNEKHEQTLPLAVSFYAPVNDTAAHINDGNCTFSVSEGKKVWSDWESGKYHENPWVAIVLGNGDTPNKTVVDHINIGFIDETGATASGVQEGHSVRLPVSYKVQYYAGDPSAMDYDANSVNNGRNWPVMSGDENWKDVTVTSQTEMPSAQDYAQLLTTAFAPVETTAIRVVMTPQTEQWVGIDELQVYGPTLALNSDYGTVNILSDGQSILDKADENHNITIELAAGQPIPTLTATAEQNAAVTVVPATAGNRQAKVIVTSEDGSASVTYTVNFKSAEPETTPVPESTPAPEITPTPEPTAAPKPTAAPEDTGTTNGNQGANNTQAAAPTAAPTAVPKSTAVPKATKAPQATATPEPTKEPTSSSSSSTAPAASATPAPTSQSSSTPATSSASQNSSGAPVAVIAVLVAACAVGGITAVWMHLRKGKQ